MIKALSRLPDGKTLVVIGLSDGNVERLKQHEPIAFNLTGIGPSTESIVIAWNDDGKVGIPKGFTGVALCFSSQALDDMRTWPQVMETDRYRFTFFRGTDEQTMERDLRKSNLIGARTIVTHKGYGPSHLPVPDN